MLMLMLDAAPFSFFTYACFDGAMPRDAIIADMLRDVAMLLRYFALRAAMLH